MAMARASKTVQKESLLSGVKKILLSMIFGTKSFPIILTLSILGLMFVLFRMKSVEQDYKLGSLNKKIEKERFVGKGLKAQKAKLLSASHLRKLAQRYNLKEPTQKQLIIIP